MALVAHHVRKDVRLLGPILLSWLAIAAGLHAVVLVGTITYVPGSGVGRTLAILFNGLLGLNVAGFIAVPVLVLQTDPAPGTTAFWLTRPLSLPRLLAAKFVMLVSLLVIVPVVLDVLTLLVAGVTPQQTLFSVADSLFVQLAWLLPVLALAAITTTLAQFVAVAAAEAAAWALIVATVTWLSGQSVPSPLASNGSAAMFIGILSGLSLAVVVISYFWRHTGGGIAVACLAPMILCFADTRLPSTAQPAVLSSVQGSVTVPLVPGSRFRLGEDVGEVLAAKVTSGGCEVVVRQVGPRPRHPPRRYPSYALRNAQGETLASWWPDFVDDPFFVTVVPVPQDLFITARTLTFQWTERADIDLETWLKGAVLVVKVR